MALRVLAVALLGASLMTSQAQAQSDECRRDPYCVGHFRPGEPGGRNPDALRNGFNVSRWSGTPLDSTKLYVVSVTSTVRQDIGPLRQAGLWTDRTTYLSLNIYFDTDQPGVVVSGNTAKIAITPYSMTKTTAGSDVRIEPMQDTRFVTLGDIRRLRVEAITVTDDQPSAVVQGVKTFLSFLAPLNALLNIGANTFFGKLAAQKANIEGAMATAGPPASATYKQNGSSAIVMNARGRITYTVTTPISSTSITIEPMRSLNEALNNNLLRDQLNTTFDTIAEGKVENKLKTCEEVAGEIGLSYAGLSLEDKAVILGYVGTKRSSSDVYAKLDCVGEDLVIRPSVQTALIGARYNFGLVRARIDRPAIDDYFRRRPVRRFFEAFGNDYIRAVNADAAARPEAIAQVARAFTPRVAISDSTRLLGLTAAEVSATEFVEALIKSGIYWIGCRSTARLEDGYGHVVAGLPREPASTGATTPPTAFAARDVRALQLATSLQGNQPAISRVLLTRDGAVTSTFAGQTCHPDAKSIGSN